MVPSLNEPFWMRINYNGSTEEIKESLRKEGYLFLDLEVRYGDRYVKVIKEGSSHEEG